jgi:hypothetical protein
VTVPERIARLPHDRRGYPIPWNVVTVEDGTPFFTINDDRRHWRALRENLCPICGEHLRGERWFTGGPRSAFDEHGWYLDLPGHHECVTFALATCPYLASPKYLGRIDVPDATKLPPELRILIDETVIPERPDVFVTVASNRVEMQERGLLFPYVRPKRPYLAHEYWRHGRQIEVEEALPFLRAALGIDWTEPKRRI